MNRAASQEPVDPPAAPIPVVPHYWPPISDSDRTDIARLAAHISARDPRLASIPPFEGVTVGMGPGRRLLLEDHSGIQLARAIGTDERLGYRALLLAREGDIVVVPGSRSLAFEAYCRNVLQLGRVKVLTSSSRLAALPLPMRCSEDEHVLASLCAAAQASGDLTLLPYMVTRAIWRLAGALAEAAGVPVHVAGPPPNLARAANDKLWFSLHAAELLGRDSVPPSHAVYGIAGLVAHLQRLGREYETVAVKLTHSAASRGNIVFKSSDICAIAAKELRDQIASLMAAAGWDRMFPVQVTAWESPLIGSPSAQLWIPAQGEGDPIVEGIFDQIVTGSEARFTGAAPSRLSQTWRSRIAGEAMKLGLLFQHLGWYGRCSFDSVVVDGPGETDAIHWVECNGRWGGVSIPMTLANRLVGDWAGHAPMILTRRFAGQRGTDTADFLARFSDDLFRPRTSEAGAVLLSPGALDASMGIDLLILGRDRDDVAARAEAITARLIA